MHRESDSFMNILTNIAVQAIVVHHAKVIIENETIDPRVLQSLNNASNIDLDTFGLFERAIANEQKFLYEHIVPMKNQSSGFLGWQRVLPNATINSLNHYYVENLQLLRNGNVKASEALTQKQEERFSLRNNLGNSVFSVAVLNVASMLETAQKHKTKLKEFRETCRTLLFPE